MMFTGHILTEDAIFGDVVSDSQWNLSNWANDHVRLAEATNREPSVLIKTTNHLLPPFIQAYLQIKLNSSNPNIDEYCSVIGNIPSDVLDLERIRRKISSKDLISAIGKRVEENSEQIQHLVAILNQWGTHMPSSRPLPIPHNGSLNGDHPSEINASSSESIAWEPCSPVTSVSSMNLPSSGTTSELATTTGETTTLPDPEGDKNLMVYNFFVTSLSPLSSARLSQSQLRGEKADAPPAKKYTSRKAKKDESTADNPDIPAKRSKNEEPEDDLPEDGV